MTKVTITAEVDSPEAAERLKAAWAKTATNRKAHVLEPTK